MIRLGLDVTDLILTRTLSSNTFDLNKAINKLTTGLEINSAKDNAAAYSITNNLSTPSGLRCIHQDNTLSGIDLLELAEAGLEQIRSQLKRLQVLAIEAANETYDEVSRNAMQQEADNIVEQIEQIRADLKYNGIQLYFTPKEEETPAVASFGLRNNAAPLTNLENYGNISTLSGANNNASEGVSFENLENSNISTLSGVNNNTPDGVSLSGLENYSNISTLSGANNNAPEGVSFGTTSPTTFTSMTPRYAVMATAEGEQTTIEGAIDIEAGATSTLTVDGITYTVQNRKTETAQTLSYIKDLTTGKIIIIIL